MSNAIESNPTIMTVDLMMSNYRDRELLREPPPPGGYFFLHTHGYEDGNEVLSRLGPEDGFLRDRDGISYKVPIRTVNSLGGKTVGWRVVEGKLLSAMRSLDPDAVEIPWDRAVSVAPFLNGREVLFYEPSWYPKQGVVETEEIFRTSKGIGTRAFLAPTTVLYETGGLIGATQIVVTAIRAERGFWVAAGHHVNDPYTDKTYHSKCDALEIWMKVTGG